MIRLQNRYLRSSEKCSVLDGLWRPRPVPDDLFRLVNFPNEVGWMIASAKNTGSQLHIDPNLMGAWNLLLTGRKWWVVVPARIPVKELTCDSACSHPMWAKDQGNVWPWFEHVLPQLRDRRSECSLASVLMNVSGFTGSLSSSSSRGQEKCCTCLMAILTPSTT